jgi:hypothetical protein
MRIYERIIDVMRSFSDSGSLDVSLEKRTRFRQGLLGDLAVLSVRV